MGLQSRLGWFQSWLFFSCRSLPPSSFLGHIPYPQWLSVLQQLVMWRFWVFSQLCVSGPFFFAWPWPSEPPSVIRPVPNCFQGPLEALSLLPSSPIQQETLGPPVPLLALTGTRLGSLVSTPLPCPSGKDSEGMHRGSCPSARES